MTPKVDDLFDKNVSLFQVVRDFIFETSDLC